MKTIKRCWRVFLLALFCFSEGCTTRGGKDRNDAVVESNNIKFSRTEIKDDATFTALVMDDGLFQVEAAKLAATHAHAEDVLQLGQLMLEDHTSANKELRKIANSLNISFPVKVSSDNQRDLDQLRNQSGFGFDKAYTDMMVRRHQDMIDAFTREAEIGSEQTIKKWAGGKIIVLQMDLEMSGRAKASVHRKK
jgi:putative membrane protein